MNSHLGILQTSSSKPYVLFSRNLMRDARQNKFRMAQKVFFSDIKEGHALVIHLEILQTTYFVIICSLQCCRLSEIVAIPGHTDLYFAKAHLVNEIGGLCNASVAGLLLSLI